MSKKIKSNESTLRNDFIVSFAASAEMFSAQALTIQTSIDDNSCADVKDAQLKIKNLKNRAQRCSEFSFAISSDETFFSAFAKRFENVSALSRLTSLAIYAQDKVYQVVSALARNVSLTTITRNNSTRELLKALLSSSMKSKHATASLMSSYNSNANVSSTQTSSSVQALRALNVITTDAQTKEHSVIDADACAALIA